MTSYPPSEWERAARVSLERSHRRRAGEDVDDGRLLPRDVAGLGAVIGIAVLVVALIFALIILAAFIAPRT